ncbi:MAG: hypothetical protein FWC40_06955 [Proteobacteria bacterium]|nr:hypothetical protein [Pseudomonadota bacterium]
MAFFIRLDVWVRTVDIARVRRMPEEAFFVRMNGDAQCSPTAQWLVGFVGS